MCKSLRSQEVQVSFRLVMKFEELSPNTVFSSWYVNCEGQVRNDDAIVMVIVFELHKFTGLLEFDR